MSTIQPYQVFNINGLSVVLYPVTTFPAIKINLAIHAGANHEKGPQWGAFHFLEHLSFEQTKAFANRKELEIYKEENSLNSNAFTGSEIVGYWVYAPNNSLKAALNYLNEVVFESIIPEQSLEKQVNIITQEIQGKWDQPSFRFNRSIAKQMYGANHIYSRDAGGQSDFIKTLKREDLLALKEEYFKNENCLLTITGNFEVNTVKELIEHTFTTKGGQKKDHIRINSTPQQKVNLHIEDVQQDRLSIIWPSQGFKDLTIEEQNQIRLGRYILGGSTRSLLNQRLREELHLVYATGFDRSSQPHAGFIEGWAATSHEKTATAVQQMRDVIYRFLEEPIDDKVFNRAKNFLKSNTLLGYDSIHSISDAITNDMFNYERIFLPKDIIDKIEEITEIEIRSILSKYVKPENEYLAVMTKDKELVL